MYDDDGNELDLSTCPYYRGEGECAGGCVEEPSCMTDRPLNGWPSERRPCVDCGAMTAGRWTGTPICSACEEKELRRQDESLAKKGE